MDYSFEEIILIVFFMIVGVVTLVGFIILFYTTVKNLMKNSFKRNILRILASLYCFGFFWFFGWFLFVEVIILGGTTLNGKVENGKYYLGGNGDEYVLISKSHYEILSIIDNSMIIYIFLCVIISLVIKLTVKGLENDLFENES